jgi:lipoprotein-releasing system ATP-binding protein
VSHIIELEAVHKRYGGGAEILSGLSLQIDVGSTTAIVGPSGSGKSTLLNLMGGLDVASSGSVRIRDTDTSSLDESGLAALRRATIGFVFQDHHLLDACTVLENALLPFLATKRRTGDEDVERARSLLRRVGLEGVEARRPAELSGGERQRVAVVRALVTGPAVVLADEPTGALDRAASSALGDLLVELNRDEGAALVVVTHSPEVAARMDRIHRLEDGVLVPAREPG